MNKTISINIGGFNFNIDEDAYERLKHYLDAIRKHYKIPEEEEIMTDIEAGIAEKFSAMVKEGQPISLPQVEEIIRVMGSVEEITSEEIPETGEIKEEKQEFGKKLYRDSDDVVIAGVASGLAAYFGVDPVFIRILFVIAVFANGLGILAYLILWMIMPKAQTSAQKLEMRGKPVNISQIQQAVKEKSKVIGAEGSEAINRLKNSPIWYRILNFPIRIIEVTFSFIKKLFKIFWPIVAVFSGIIIIAGALGGIIAISAALGFALFNLNSPYITSDLPISELSVHPLYYPFALSTYFVAFIPIIILLFFGVALLLRKNTFKPVVVGILVSIWVLSIVICATAAGNLIPLFKSKINEISKAEEITRTYDQKDFDKLYIKGKYNFKIKQGTNYSITMTGRSSDLDRVAFKNENKQLEITQNKRNTENKICVFCFDKEITGEITMPKLDSFVGVGDSEANISGFKDNIYLSVGEVNSTEIALNGQNVKAQIAGVDSELEMTGTASTVSAKLIGVGEISTYNFKAGNIDLDMDNFSRAKLIGEVNNFKAELRGTSELSGLDFSANKADVITKDFSRAEIWAKDKLTLVSQDNSSMVYKNTSASLEKNILDNGSIEVSDRENKESQAPEKIHIKTETDQYSPAMSSIRGMGLTVSDNSNEPGIYYLWKTDRGYFVKDWQAPEKAKEMSIHFPEDKIYWTYFPSDEKIEKGAAVNIYLEKREKESENTVDTDQVLLKMGDYGKIFLVK